MYSAPVGMLGLLILAIVALILIKINQFLMNNKWLHRGKEPNENLWDIFQR